MKYEVLRKLIKALEIAESKKELACHILDIKRIIGDVLVISPDNDIPTLTVVWVDYFLKMNGDENAQD